ncbi:MAG: phosphate/phosphite/phosphonate ABC transporter substrate-binding protein [Myxacorys californica WJT36-NPBG1]|nr:phosphate/phosphite/phosphonate ABC transporter substrate-binding protein [Myxacorys californica WJT36-NPBG1]
MQRKFPRRLFLASLFIAACSPRSHSSSRQQLVLGTVSYGSGEKTIAQYDRLIRYLEEKLQAVVQLEPAYNERKALERLKSQAWSIVFAPPGLAAIALTKHRYLPVAPLAGVSSLRSVLVVLKNSPYQTLGSLAGKTLAIGQPGSAVGYYFPIFNLYGLTLASLAIPGTPKAILDAISQGKADVGALSLEEFNTYKTEVNQAEFRILFTDAHTVPSGLVLISPNVDRTVQESIQKLLNDMPSVVAQEAGFVPNGMIPDYTYMISVVERVRTIFPAETEEGAALLTQKPVRLFRDGETPPETLATPAATPPPSDPSTSLPDPSPT